MALSSCQEMPLSRRLKELKSLPLLFAQDIIYTIRSGYEISFEDFKKKMGQSLKVQLLPFFNGIDKTTDDSKLTTDFYDVMNFESLYTSEQTFKGVLREAKVVGEEAFAITSTEHLKQLAEDFFDSQVSRMLDVVKGENPPSLKDFYNQEDSGELWRDLKTMIIQLWGCPRKLDTVLCGKLLP